MVKCKAVCADEAGLLSVFRETVAVKFGDQDLLCLSQVWLSLQFSDPLVHGALRDRGVSAGTADNNDDLQPYTPAQPLLNQGSNTLE